MSVRVGDDAIFLEGNCVVEDAEQLLAALLDCPDHVVDVAGVVKAHLAVVQLLHAAGQSIRGQSDDAFVRCVMPADQIGPADKIDSEGARSSI